MTDTPSPDVAESSPYTERSHADLELGELAREVSDFARRMVPTGPRGESTSGYRLADALALQALVGRLVEAVVVTERQNYVSWRRLGEIADPPVSDSTAHGRWSPAETEWKTQRRKWLRHNVMGGPDRDDTVAERAARLDQWVTRHTEPGDLDHGPHPVTDRLDRMDPATESVHLSVLRQILLSDCPATPGAPGTDDAGLPLDLLLPLEQRQAAVDAALAAALPEGPAAAEAWHRARRSRTYAESLDTQIRSAAAQSSAPATAPRIDTVDAVYLDGPLAGQRGYALNTLGQRVGFALPPRPGGPTGEYEVITLAHQGRPASLRLIRDTPTDSQTHSPAAPSEDQKP
ncbi:hypothetical protein AB0L82_35820 [Nocardia sp. NPDC052001]|uniref:hypothetical protein n=1 Tax=Nocardia sp. NPDC052001 TaxID=3154853 RepID=UPI0034233BEC